MRFMSLLHPIMLIYDYSNKHTNLVYYAIKGDLFTRLKEYILIHTHTRQNLSERTSKTNLVSLCMANVLSHFVAI